MRAPAPQAASNVVVLPMEGGQPSGKYEVFADGFAGPDAHHQEDEEQDGGGRGQRCGEDHRTGTVSFASY